MHYTFAILVGWLCWAAVVSGLCGMVPYAFSGHGFWKTAGRAALFLGIIPAGVVCLIRYGIVPLWHALA